MGLCSEDILFWLNTFIWTYSPKDHGNCPVVPWVCWPYQVSAFEKMAAAIGHHDLLIEKSRDMGASWMCLLVFLWRWLFASHQTFLLVSRVEELVDKKNDPDSLFWKLDFAIDCLPSWMRPKIDRKRLALTNLDNNSTIIGTATTTQTSRGGRRTAMLLDEFAAVDNGHSMLAASRDNTKCRFFNSTPLGTGNAFYEMSCKLDTSRKVRLHWTEHPLKAEGLYFARNGKIEMPTGDHLPEGFNPIMDGKLRSPWYDGECRRSASDQEIAQELDIDYHRSGWQFFSDEILTRLRTQIKPPIWTGALMTVAGTVPIFHQAEGGPLKIWCNLLGGSRPAMEDYSVGCDIATGSRGEHASRSAGSVIEVKTGVKVAEYLTSSELPMQFADSMMELCAWFNDAFLVWEANGPGGEFGRHVVDSGFRNFYYRRNEEAIIKRHNGAQPGWWSQRKTKRILLSEYGEALSTGKFINPSGEALEECRQYIHNPDGDIVHASATSAYDPTQRGDNHGDIVIADSLAWRGLKDKRPNITAKAQESLTPPEGSLAWRLQERDRSESATEFGWFDSPRRIRLA